MSLRARHNFSTQHYEINVLCVQPDLWYSDLVHVLCRKENLVTFLCCRNYLLHYLMMRKPQKPFRHNYNLFFSLSKSRVSVLFYYN
jgi:hypothetical protein